jgi:hypothetical protein
MRFGTLAYVLGLSVCACTTAAPQPGPPHPFPARAPEPAPRESVPLAPLASDPATDGLARLLLDGPVVGCKRFDVLVGDRTGTRQLMLRVDADHLKLAAGEHALPIDDRFVALELAVFDAPTGPLLCSDVSARPGEKRERWRARTGTVRLAWTDEPKRGEPFAVDVELVAVELVADDGRAQTIGATLSDVRVGWIPG